MSKFTKEQLSQIAKEISKSEVKTIAKEIFSLKEVADDKKEHYQRAKFSYKMYKDAVKRSEVFVARYYEHVCTDEEIVLFYHPEVYEELCQLMKKINKLNEKIKLEDVVDFETFTKDYNAIFNETTVLDQGQAHLLNRNLII
jgi:flagellar motor switch protein FliG